MLFGFRIAVWKKTHTIFLDQASFLCDCPPVSGWRWKPHHQNHQPQLPLQGPGCHKIKIWYQQHSANLVKEDPPYDSETISCRWSWWEWVRCPAHRPRWTRRWKPPKEDPSHWDCPNVPKKIVHNYYHLQSKVGESSAKWEDGTASEHRRPWSSPTHEEPGERHCNPLGHSLGQVGLFESSFYCWRYQPRLTGRWWSHHRSNLAIHGACGTTFHKWYEIDFSFWDLSK